MNLTNDELNNLYRLRNKIVHSQATSVEMRNYFKLIIKSSEQNRAEIERYIHEIGYNSIEEFETHLNKKNNEELINGLVLLGGAVLFGYSLKKILDE